MIRHVFSTPKSLDDRDPDRSMSLCPKVTTVFAIKGNTLFSETDRKRGCFAFV